MCVEIISVDRIEDAKISLIVKVISKKTNYFPNEYITFNSKNFSVLKELNVKKNDNVYEIILSYLDKILNQLFSFKNITFSEFKKRTNEFDELLHNIFNCFSDDMDYMRETKSFINEFGVDQYIQFLWLFKDSIDFHLFINHVIKLLKIRKKKYKNNYDEDLIFLNFLNYLLTTTNNGVVDV